MDGERTSSRALLHSSTSKDMQCAHDPRYSGGMQGCEHSAAVITSDIS
jgi:hypothetical protein